MRTAPALCLALTLSLATSAAPACGNSYITYYAITGARRALDQAEQALARSLPSVALRAAHEVATTAADGTPVRAFNQAIRDFSGGHAWRASVPEMDTIDGLPAAAPPTAGQELLARARLLRGIAIARMDGQLNQRLTPLRRATAEQREARFRFALDDLAAAVAASPNDPRALAYQAEARARHAPAEVPAARTVLRDLARRDLLPDAHTWAMLARLEDSPDARAQALARCAAVAGRNASRACVP